MENREVKLKFDYMEGNDVCSSVTVYKDGSIECEDFVKEPFRQVFGKCPHTIEYLYKFFERRCFARTHFAVKEALASIGLTQYNPYDIVKITHGVMCSDHNWIRFDGEDLTWEKVQPK